MPFLTKKTAGGETSRTPQNGLGASSGLAWEGVVYEPSKIARELNSSGFSSLHGPVPQRRLCGNAECANGWTMPWRNRKRPIFEAQWACSGRCVLAMVRAAVGRELGDGETTSTVVAPHRHRVPLGLLMLAQGWITHPQLQKALAAQRESGTGRIGEWLMSECGLEADQVVRGLSMQWGCPVLTTEGFSPENMALVMPRVFVEEFGILPLRLAGSRILYLGFADRLDASAAFAVEQMAELKVESGVVEASQFEDARGRLLASEGVEMRLETIKDKETMAGSITAILEQKQPIASRLIRLHQYYWLRLWLERGVFGKTGSVPVKNEDVVDHVFAITAQ
jgi:Type II secretion system (T2SS), protein E, N-terminal domain